MPRPARCGRSRRPFPPFESPSTESRRIDLRIADERRFGATRVSPSVHSVEQRRLQRVESDSPDVERLLVERLDVEGCSLPARVLVAQLLPDALSDLVRRSLPRPPEIAVHLEAHETLVHVDVLRQEPERILTCPGTGAVGELLLE